MAGRSARTERAVETRDTIMATAERLFADHGLAAVSSRQISEAAGQGNNTAVGYHFGAKAELVRAMLDRHIARIEQIRERLLAEAGDSDDIRDWVGCLVRPFTEHLESLGTPSWYARFVAQVMTDPGLREAASAAAIAHPPLHRTLQEIDRRRPELPSTVRQERDNMARLLIVHTCAERERALAEGTGTLHPSWDHVARSLTDAITGLLLAPVTPCPSTATEEKPR